MKRTLLKTVFACLLAAGLAGFGYERVQDTETGEYYRAENGFTDWYDGTRYRPATDNAAYLTPVSGYINWK